MISDRRTCFKSFIAFMEAAIGEVQNLRRCATAQPPGDRASIDGPFCERVYTVGICAPF
jgi:hypothetical protein